LNAWKKSLTAGYSLLDHRRNEDILEGSKVDLVKEKLAQYEEIRLNYVSKREDIRYSKQLLDYRHIERRKPGRP